MCFFGSKILHFIIAESLGIVLHNMQAIYSFSSQHPIPGFFKGSAEEMQSACSKLAYSSPANTILGSVEILKISLESFLSG